MPSSRLICMAVVKMWGLIGYKRKRDNVVGKRDEEDGEIAVYDRPLTRANDESRQFLS